MSSPGFVDLDDRLLAEERGLLLASAETRASERALVAHVRRRLRARDLRVVAAEPRTYMPIWMEVAARLEVRLVSRGAESAADTLALAASAARAAIVAQVPKIGSWDRAVTDALAVHPLRPLVVLVGHADSLAGAAGVGPDVFRVEGDLDRAARERWCAGIADEMLARAGTPTLTTLEAFWSRAADGALGSSEEIPSEADRVLSALSLAARPLRADDVVQCGGSDALLRLLVRAGAVDQDDGWFAVASGYERRAQLAAAQAPATVLARVADVLATRHPGDPWAGVRAAEILLRSGQTDEAEAAYAGAHEAADDPLARREIALRWMRHTNALPQLERRRALLHASRCALAASHAAEALEWAKGAVAVDGASAQVALVLGRAYAATGDLTSAEIAFQRGRELAGSASTPADTGANERAIFAAALADLACRSGDLETATREARDALTLECDAETRLDARNVLGKVLLARASWDEADRHFTEDAWTALSHGRVEDELRARVNRGIAILSKGLVEEARSAFEAVLATGERIGSARASAFALDNLAVVAIGKHELGLALEHWERAFEIRRRLGDPVALAHILGNIASLRIKLGLTDYAAHAIAFGRRTLGPGMPPTRSAHFNILAARVALTRANLVEAHREATRAIADGELCGSTELLCEALALAAEIALEEGAVHDATQFLARARPLATTPRARADLALLTALHAQAAGAPCLPLALSALAMARVAEHEERARDAHALLAEVYQAEGDASSARSHAREALALRDLAAAKLRSDLRATFLARPDVARLARLEAAAVARATTILPPPNDGTLPTLRCPSSGPAPQGLVGEDPAIRTLRAAIRKVAASDGTVLIGGESGTGKELIAEAIHRASPRAGEPWVAVNCAALVDNLLLSELFGHEKGAFTGAASRRRGRFELAAGGTLFLDEIGDISPRTQVALLRVLQERTFERVGGASPIRVEARVICATHRNLQAMVKRGEFREDLYYRLRGITLVAPPLRRRIGDLPYIAQHLLERIARERREPTHRLAPDALALLARHAWPGNVRELENVLRAVSLFAGEEVITAAHIVENVDELGALAMTPASADARDPSSLPPSGEMSIAPTPPESSVSAAAFEEVRHGAVSLPKMKLEIERACISRALAETKGNITRAASMLGMKRPRLSQLVKQYGLTSLSILEDDE